MNQYLQSTDIIDWKTPQVRAKAKKIAQGLDSPEEIARKCFEYVRDEIKHSWDFKLNPITCSASEVLGHGTGYCYAKSHLLAALLRANNIPAGLCYQRLIVSDDGSVYCLHGLNAVYLEPYGWYRVDPRGNKPGVSAAFTPPNEALPFPVAQQGEVDLPEIWPEPLKPVVEVLSRYATYDAVAAHLPDVELIG
jgi:transglutaminase-like putative cysteine protease